MLASPIYPNSPTQSPKSNIKTSSCRHSPPINRNRKRLTLSPSDLNVKRLKLVNKEIDDFDIRKFWEFSENMNIPTSSPNKKKSINLNFNFQQLAKNQSSSSSSSSSSNKTNKNDTNSKSTSKKPIPSTNLLLSTPKNSKSTDTSSILSNSKNFLNLSKNSVNISKSPNPSSSQLRSRKRNINHTVDDDMETDSSISCKKVILPYHHTAITTSNGHLSMDDTNIGTNTCMINHQQQQQLENYGEEKIRDLKDSSSRTLDNLSSDLLKSIFENKYKYYKRLKQLPSQQQQQGVNSCNTSLGNHLSCSLQNSMSQVSNSGCSTSTSTSSSIQKPKKVILEDAIKILEMILVEQEDKMKEEFNIELQSRLNDQYDSFVKYNEEYVKANRNFDCSYLS
jgi:hypothetical protein